MRTCHGILIECIQLTPCKGLVRETVVVVFCVFVSFFVVPYLVYIILIMYMNIDFFTKFNVMKLTLMLLFTHVSMYEQ